MARVTISRGRPAQFAYIAPTPGDLFATTACAGCEAFLDIDQTGRATQFPGILLTVRKVADLWAPGFPALTVKAPPVPPRPTTERGTSGES